MNKWTRRAFIVGAGSTVAACSNSIRESRSQRIDYRVKLALQQMYSEVPGSRDLADRAAGMLVMPTITQAGFGFGGAYGVGALMIGGAPVSYYSMAQGSYGFQLGLQQYAHTLFFMNDKALADFRNSNGWQIGADAQYVVKNQGDSIGTNSTKLLSPVIALVYGRAGLIVGATLEGTKYSRILR